jgi:hypothetical protein
MSHDNDGGRCVLTPPARSGRHLRYGELHPVQGQEQLQFVQAVRCVYACSRSSNSSRLRAPERTADFSDATARSRSALVSSTLHPKFRCHAHSG